MKKRIIAIGSLLVASVLIFMAVKAIRFEHYPVHVDPSPEWEPYVSSLDAQRESFFVDSDGTLLEAELFIPNGGQAKKPAVVFAPGSGDSLYQNYAWGFIEAYLLDPFLSRDMAVLLINKRGMGQSEGNYVRNSIEGRAADIYAAVQSIQAHPSIDEANIGLIGHSQGGWVVTHAAAEHSDIAFFINLAGPTMMQIEQATDMYTHEARCKGLEGDALDKYVERRVNGTLLGIKIGEITNFGYFGFDARTMYYNPSNALKTVSSPGLFIFAENDNLVTPVLNIQRMNEIFNGDVPNRLTMVTVDDATHAFRLVNDPCESWVDVPDQPRSEELTVVLNNWLTEQGY